MPAMYRTATFADKREGGASVTGEEIFFLLRPVKTAGSPPETHRPMPPACARPPPESAPAPPASRAARPPSSAAPPRGTRHREIGRAKGRGRVFTEGCNAGVAAR